VNAADYESIADIEHAWVDHYTTEKPRNATEDIQLLIVMLRTERQRHLAEEKKLSTELAAANKARDDQAQRAKDFARIAFKNGNEVLVGEARIRWLEEKLDEILDWADKQEARDVLFAVRAVLNEYIEDDKKLHKDTP
jgi:hypothetical protein